MKKFLYVALSCLFASYMANAVNGASSPLTELFSRVTGASNQFISEEDDSVIMKSSEKVSFSSGKSLIQTRSSNLSNLLGEKWGYYLGDGEGLSYVGNGFTGTHSSGMIVNANPGFFITAVNVPFYSSNVKNIYVDVCSSDNLSSPLTRTMVDEVTEGYNTVILDSPVQIPENGKLFVSYTFTSLDNGYPIAVVETYSNEDSFYYSYAGGYWDKYSDYYTSALQVFLSPSAPEGSLKLVAYREDVSNFLGTLDSYPGLKSELQAAYNKTNDNMVGAEAEAALSELKTVYTNVKKAVEIYPIILADIELAQVVLKEGAYVDVAEAVALGQAINVSTSKSAAYFAAYDALETSLAVYQSDKVQKSDWAFNTNSVCTVDGLRYYLDTTNKLAEFINFNSSNAYSGALNIPATIRYNGTTYAVVAMINNSRYTQSNITSVTLPKSLRYIGDYGLGYFSNVRSIEIPENVTSMGSYVFSNSSNLTSIKMNATIPPTIASMSGSSYKKIFIPAESFHAYRTANIWKDNVLVGGNGTTVSTGKIAAGDLGHVILDEATYLQEVNKLIIDEGTLNNDDWTALKSMTNLIELDMEGVTMASLPANAFDGKWAIEKVVLPHNITSIGNYAFRGTGIKEITFPESLTTLGTYSFNNCDSLSVVSLPNSITTIPNYSFYDCDRLQKVLLPSGLTAIGQNAFNGCDLLSEVSLPESLTSIGSYAFRYCPIKSISIPSGIKSIDAYLFADNAAIESLVIPGTVETINNYAFSNCTSLKDVQFEEGLSYIYSSAFQNCKAIEQIVLPSSLEICQGTPFYNCSGIKRIEARSVIPPTTGGSCPINNVDISDVVLFVPSWSTSEYQLAAGWSSFYTIDVTDFMPQYIKVNKDFYFTARDAFESDYRPNIFMTYSDVQSTDAYGYTNYERGNLTISGRSKLAVNDFSFIVSPFAKYYADQSVSANKDYDYYRTNLNSTSLIVNGEMRAENVTLLLNNYNSRWQFVTFPFDVKVSDIVQQEENTSWVIRGHNGAMRAAGKNDAVWENLSADDVLEAGKGYIMHNYNPDNTNSWFWVYPLKNSVNRQLIFSSEDRTIELEENLAEFDHNRSWNLIGNPYPCFYDSRFMDFDAPFMVWNSYKQSYVAYNPADDAYILSPGEAFFVQRPFDQASITFRKEGRQTHRYAREMDVNSPARIKVKENASRRIFNIELRRDSLTDCTRIVLNDEADMKYEMSRDAAKFVSTELYVPQVFTIKDATRYAINERPIEDGSVQLGIYCGADGEYMLSIDKVHDYKVVLEDKVANAFVELTADVAYAFTASAGEVLNRFVLHFINATTGIENVESEVPVVGETIYNLKGMRVKNSQEHGIYIKNGQKTTVK